VYHPRRVRLEVFQTEPPQANDPSFAVRPENARAHHTTEEFYLLAQ